MRSGWFAVGPVLLAVALAVGALGGFGLLPEGQPERSWRERAMVEAMEREPFRGCSSHRECEAVCPKRFSVSTIARLNRDTIRGSVAHMDHATGKVQNDAGA